MADMDKYPLCTIELNGRTFQAFTAPDDCGDMPWERDDGRGPVSDWRKRESKRAGELVLCEDRGSCRFYDFAAAVKLARKDGWGAHSQKCDYYRSKVCQCGAAALSKGAQAEKAARMDFEFLRGYCRGDWYYVGVIVKCEGEHESVWGIESNADEYLKETAHDLATELDRCLRDQAQCAQVAKAFL